MVALREDYKNTKRVAQEDLPVDLLGVSGGTKESKRGVKSKTQRRAHCGLEDKTTMGGGSRRPSDVAEVIEAFRASFALTDSALRSLAEQPSANSMARRAIDRYGLPRVLAALSIAPRHKWVAGEFLMKRSVPSLQVLLSDKVLLRLVNEVSER